MLGLAELGQRVALEHLGDGPLRHEKQRARRIVEVLDNLLGDGALEVHL
jgi:hypothetical protein